ncbi:MAG: hypothetical protein U5Q44_09540 [Dehalococcoidia bacterium]|nr:hypothetical protein [Dehalococcoidia bacterium]
MAPRRRFEELDNDAVQAVAELFACEAQVEPYTPDGESVYRLEPHGGPADGIRIVIWPSLDRVDVSRTKEHGWVLKDVGAVEIIPGVEAVFRPKTVDGFLFVSVNGWVNMVIG